MRGGYIGVHLKAQLTEFAAGLVTECRGKQETRTPPRSGHEQLADFWEYPEVKENYERRIYQERELTRALFEMVRKQL